MNASKQGSLLPVSGEEMLEHVKSKYRMMDKLYAQIDQVKKCTFERIQSLFPNKIDLVFFNEARKIYKALDLTRSEDATIYLP